MCGILFMRTSLSWYRLLLVLSLAVYVVLFDASIKADRCGFVFPRSLVNTELCTLRPIFDAYRCPYWFCTATVQDTRSELSNRCCNFLRCKAQSCLVVVCKRQPHAVPVLTGR